MTSDSEPWTDDETSEEYVSPTPKYRNAAHHRRSVLCLTSSGPRTLNPTDILRPHLPHHLTFKPLEDSSSLFNNTFFAITPSPISGWGAFALRDLHKGECILAETPLFTATPSSLFKEFAKLTSGDRGVVWSLAENKLCKPGTPRLQSIWNANWLVSMSLTWSVIDFFSFSIGRSLKAGLFPIASRFNHACHPSDTITYTYNTTTKTLELFVQAEMIPAGQELTISYGFKRTPLELFCRYGFRCGCGACEGVEDDELLESW